MAISYFLLLTAACFSAYAFPQDPLPPTRNTIFLDEKLEGGVFEFIDDVNELTFNEQSNSPYRLPTTTRPQHYNIDWTIQIPTLSFLGTVDIQLYATQPNVNEIVIHAHDLNITSLSLSLGNVNIEVRDYVFEPVYHFLRVRILNGVLQYSATQNVVYTLSIGFEAPLRTDMYGIYRSWFRNNANDQVRWMASTQFQATAARFAFPCYDEPSFKATFDVTIRRPSAYSSWFCTRRSHTNTNVSPGYDADVYHTTPVMSTYLLALIVAEYESLDYSPNGVLMYEVIARPNAINTGQGIYSFEVGMDLLEEMNDHTNYNFFNQHSQLKMTQAAIPDFGAGAMENWGLLTYREAYLMYDPNHTNKYFQQLIAYILSHEIAHMWFGNLVTCDWWDVLWLNEGFARYYQYFLTDWVETEMGLGIRFINEQVHTALLTDSANNPYPLSNPGVGSPSSVSAMFTTISYNKGACIIRMTEHLLGFNVHRQGLRNYLVQRQFNTALPIHLFEALQSAAVAANAISEYGPDFSVVEYYRTWTEQSGHPVLNVEIDHQTGLMTIYQRRFNINSGYSTATTNWIVPITFATASNPNFSNTKPTHIVRDAITVIDSNTSGNEWIIFNKQQTGFYRVNYDDYSWNLIVAALRGPERTLIHPYNRAQIVNDVFQFARAGIMSYSRAFNIVSFLANETDYNPWVAAITAINWIRNRLQGSTYLASFDALLIEWSSTVMNTVGYVPTANEPFMTSYLRYQVAPFVCNLNVAACRQSARTQFNQLVNNGIEVPVDSRNWVYCNVLRDGNLADFQFLWNRFLNHNVYTEKILLLQTLGCTSNPQALNTLLDAIVQENHIIRPQDYTTAFSTAVSGNEGNTQLVFQYIQNNLDDVIEGFNSASTPLSYISSRLRTVAAINEFQQWADDNRARLGSWYQAVRNGAESSRQSLQWALEVQADIQSYITQRDEVIASTTPGPVVTSPATTVTPVPLVQPSTPALPVPDSANTSFLSAIIIALAMVANFAM